MFITYGLDFQKFYDIFGGFTQTHSSGFSSLLLGTQCTQFLANVKPFLKIRLLQECIQQRQQPATFTLLDENVYFPLITVISSRIILFSLETVIFNGLIT